MKTKEALLESSKRHKLMLKNELLLISDKTTLVARNIAVIGGVVAGAYLLFKLISQEDTDSEVPEEKTSIKKFTPSGIGRVGKVLINQALMFVLNEIKNRIQEYLNEIEKDAANT